MGFWSDVGNAVSGAASAIGDAVEDTVDAVTDTVEDVVDTVVDTIQGGVQAGADWLCANAGDVGCFLGNVVGGAIDGALEGVQDILHDVFDIVRDVGGLVGSILRLDLPGFLKGLGTLILDILDLGVDLLRFVTGGYLVGGVVKYFKRSMLRRFVARLVKDTFSGAVRDTVRSRIGLDGSKRFGFRLTSIHRVFVLDSRDVPLWQMHENGALDLYALAHLLSFDSFAIGTANPTTVVKTVDAHGNDELFPVTRWQIAKYLESRGDKQRLRVYAMSRQAIADKLNTASRKLDEMAVILNWNDGEDYSWFRDYTRQFVTGAEYNFMTGGVETLFARADFNRAPNVNCELLSTAGFVLDRFGIVAGRDILECDDFPSDCLVPARSDKCCSTIDRKASSGTLYRDAYPSDTMSYVLAHEIGHYMGLCHCGHDGFQNVMFTAAEGSGVSILDWGLFSFYYQSEPGFSLKDGKNTWRFIVAEMRDCLGAPPVMPVMQRRQAAVKAHSCAVPHEARTIEPEQVPAIATTERWQ
jgi:hypothetical protein